MVIVNGATCEAEGFKECSSCKSILRNTCSKQMCRSTDGKRPKMIAPSKQLVRKSAQSTRLHESETEDEEYTETAGPSRKSTRVCAQNNWVWYDIDSEEEDYSEFSDS